MKKILMLIIIALCYGCNQNQKIIGKYTAVEESAIIETISFDGEVASFGGTVGKLMPSAKYDVKNDKVYINTSEGILVFDIIDSNTIECTTSIFKGSSYKK